MQTRYHDAQITTSTSDNSFVNVDLSLTNDRIALSSFEISAEPFTVKTLTDGAEDSGTRLFDTSIIPPGVANPNTAPLWTRNSFRAASSPNAYRFVFDSATPGTDYPLPQFVQVEATATSKLRYQRAFFFTASQILFTQISVDNAQLIDLLQETGSNNFQLADSPFTERVIDLAQYAGQLIEISFRYRYSSSWQNFDNSVSIDSIQLENVLSDTESSISQSGIANSTTFFDLSGLVAGSSHDIRLRAHHGGHPTAFSPQHLVTMGTGVTTVNVVTSGNVFIKDAVLDIGITFSDTISIVSGSPILSLNSVCPEKANFEILNFYKATTCFMKTCYGFNLFSEIELSTGCYG